MHTPQLAHQQHMPVRIFAAGILNNDVKRGREKSTKNKIALGVIFSLVSFFDERILWLLVHALASSVNESCVCARTRHVSLRR